MENKKAKEIFDEQFKFDLNQEVRHRGDNKNGFSSDMGLLVLRRTLEEHSDDDENVHYTRNYICRMIRFSGSGDLAAFKESELMSMSDYNRKQVEDKEERDEIHQEMNQIKKGIFKSFGVDRNQEVYLKKDGVTDKSRVYVVSGFSSDKDATILKLRGILGEGMPASAIEVKSKDEFEVITNQ